MSGTSMDGIDVAMLVSDGETVFERGPSATFTYTPEERHRLRQALIGAQMLVERHLRPAWLADLERAVTERHAQVFRDFCREEGVDPAAIDAIGFHGQTVLHRPEQQLTVQIGDGPLLAKLTGIDVVYDLRAADVAAGGQGAPLVPVYHQALAERLPQRPVAFLNLGGVANITWVGTSGVRPHSHTLQPTQVGSDPTDDRPGLVAFDTGPGNALLDDWMHRRTGKAQDTDGAMAQSGQIDEGVLRTLLSHPYFGALPPKSLDRNAFDLVPLNGLCAEDGAATLVAFTARAVRVAATFLPEAPKTWIVCGGGRRNPVLMAALAAELDAAVAPAEILGLDGDSMEAEAWAFLAVRSLKGLPISFPMTTGVPTPMTGGVLARGRR
jgi:anhydro-N-acetylmuramic acid kinase